MPDQDVTFGEEFCIPQNSRGKCRECKMMLMSHLGKIAPLSLGNASKSISHVWWRMFVVSHKIGIDNHDTSRSRGHDSGKGLAS